MDRHNKSFFGQKTGMILDSDNKSQPFIFFRFIKKRQDNNWEKFKEGKTIRLSLEELINILEVLKENQNEWKTMHTYENDSTNIEIRWEKGNRRAISIRAGAYKKMLYEAEILLLEMLLKHILKEKIAFSTVLKFNRSSSSRSDPTSEHLIIVEEQSNSLLSKSDKANNETEIKGKISGETEKALCIDFGQKEVWVPKSTIKSDYQPIIGMNQEFLIDTWILKKNAILT
jgi:hypothetical protein